MEQTTSTVPAILEFEYQLESLIFTLTLTSTPITLCDTLSYTYSRVSSAKVLPYIPPLRFPCLLS